MKSPDDAELIAARGDMTVRGRTFLLGGVLSAAGVVDAGGFAGCSRKPSTSGGGPESWRVPEAASPVRAPAPPSATMSALRVSLRACRPSSAGWACPVWVSRSAASARSTTTCSGPSGLWNMSSSQSSNFWEMCTLPQVAFHVREQVEGRQVARPSGPSPPGTTTSPRRGTSVACSRHGSS